jgi:hypothetical protein
MPDELEAGLKRRDSSFLVRLLLRLAVLILVAVWIYNSLGENSIGGCVARGFGSLTGDSAVP